MQATPVRATGSRDEILETDSPVHDSKAQKAGRKQNRERERKKKERKKERHKEK